VRNKKIVGTVGNGAATNGTNNENGNSDAMDVDHDGNDDSGENVKVLTLEPIDDNKIPPHNSVFINELKISDFKQVLMKNNINAEFSGGALWCANSTLAIRRIDTGKLSLEGCLSEDYYKVRDLLYDQYAII